MFVSPVNKKWCLFFRSLAICFLCFQVYMDIGSIKAYGHMHLLSTEDLR